MELIVQRNVHVDIAESSYTCEKEERYKNVSNVYMEGKQKKHYTNEIKWETLVLFNDKDHKGFNKNYVYIGKNDTMEIK